MAMTTQQALRKYYSELEYGRHTVRESEMEILRNAQRKMSFEETMGRSYANLAATMNNSSDDNENSWEQAQQLAGALLVCLDKMEANSKVPFPPCFELGIRIGGGAFMSNTTTLYTKVPVRKFISLKVSTLETLDKKLLRPGAVINVDLVGVDRTKAFVSISKLECIVQAAQLRKTLALVYDLMGQISGPDDTPAATKTNETKKNENGAADKDKKPPIAPSPSAKHTTAASKKKKKSQEVYDDQGDIADSKEFVAKRQELQDREEYLGKADGIPLSTKGKWTVNAQLKNPYTNQFYALKKQTGQCLNCLAPDCGVLGLVGQARDPKMRPKVGAEEGATKDDAESPKDEDEIDEDVGTLCTYCATGILSTPFSGAEVHIDFIDTLLIGNHGEMIQAQLRNTAVKFLVDEDDRFDHRIHDDKTSAASNNKKASKKKPNKKERMRAAAKRTLNREGDFGVLRRMRKSSISHKNRLKEALKAEDGETKRISQYINEQLDIDYEAIVEAEKGLTEEERQKKAEERTKALHDKLRKAEKAKEKIRVKHEEALEKHKEEKHPKSEEGLSSSTSSEDAEMAKLTRQTSQQSQEGGAIAPVVSSSKKSFVLMRTNINVFVFNTQFVVWEPMVDHLQVEARGLLEANTWHLNIPNKSEFIISPFALALLTTVPLTLMPADAPVESRAKAKKKSAKMLQQMDSLEKSVDLNALQHQKLAQDSMEVRVINKHSTPVKLIVAGEEVEIPAATPSLTRRSSAENRQISADSDVQNGQHSGTYQLVTSDTFLLRGKEKIQLLFEQHFFFLLQDVVCEMCINDEDPDPKVAAKEGDSKKKTSRRTILLFPFHPSGAIIRIKNMVPCDLEFEGIGVASADGGEAYLPPAAPLSNPLIMQPLGLVKGRFLRTETTRRKMIPSFQAVLNGLNTELFSQHSTEKRLLLSFRVSAQSEGSIFGAPRMTILIEGGSSFTNNLPIPIYVDVKYEDGDDDVDDRYKLFPQETRQLIHTNNVRRMKLCFRGVQEQTNEKASGSSESDEADDKSSANALQFTSSDLILEKGQHDLHLFSMPQAEGTTPPTSSPSTASASAGKAKAQAPTPLAMTWQYVVNDECNHFTIQAPFSIVNHSPISLILVEESTSAKKSNMSRRKSLKDAWKRSETRTSEGDDESSEVPEQNYLHLGPDMTAPLIATPAQAPDLLVRVMTKDKKYASKKEIPLHAAGTVGQIILEPVDKKDIDGDATPTIQLTYFSVLTSTGCMSVKIVPRWAVINKTPWSLRISQKTMTEGAETADMIVEDNSALPMMKISMERNPDKDARKAAKKTGGSDSAPFFVTISRAEERDKDRGSPLPVGIEELTDALVALPESELSSTATDGQPSTKHFATQLRVSVFPDGPRQFLIIEPAGTSAFLLVNRTHHTISLLQPSTATTGPKLKKEAAVESKDGVITPMQALVRETTKTRNTQQQATSSSSAASGKRKPDDQPIIATAKPFERRTFAVGQSASSEIISGVEMLFSTADSKQANGSGDTTVGAFLVPVSESDGTPPTGKHLLRLGSIAYVRVTQGSVGQIIVEVLPRNDSDLAEKKVPQVEHVDPKAAKMKPTSKDHKEAKADKDKFPTNSAKQQKFCALADLPMTTTKSSCKGLAILLPAGSPSLDVALNLSYMSVSLVQQPREIISGAIVDLRCRFERSEKLQTVQLSLLNFQFDNQTEERPPYQGMLFPIRRKNSDPAMQAIVQQRLLPGKDNMCFKEIRFEMCPIAIRSSDLILFRLMEFQQNLMANSNAISQQGAVSAADITEMADTKLQKQSTAVLEISNDPNAEDAEELEEMIHPKFDKKDYDSTYHALTLEGLYDAAPVSAGIMQSSVTIEKMIINPLIVRLWFERQRGNAQRDIVRSTIQIAFLSHLVMSVEDVRVKVPGLTVTAQTGRLQSHINKFQNFYIGGIMKQLAAIMLSFASQIPLVGAPIKLVSGVGASAIGFFEDGVDMSSPDAFAKGLASSTAALAGNVVGGSIVALGSVFSSGAKLTAIAAGEQNDEGRPMNALTGFAKGFKGLFTKPIKGAAEEGATGLATGLGQGVLGIVAAPVSGILGDIGRGTRFVGSAMAGDGSVVTEVTRLRPIRPFYPGGAVAPLGAFIEVFQFQRKYHSDRLYWSNKMLTGEGSAWKPESKEDVKKKNPNIMSDAWVLDRCPGTTFEGWTFDETIKGNFDRSYEPKKTHLRRRRWVVINHTKEPSGVTPPMQNVASVLSDTENYDEDEFLRDNDEEEYVEPRTLTDTRSSDAKNSTGKSQTSILENTLDERERLLAISANSANKLRKEAATRVFAGAHRAILNLNEVPTTIIAEVFENQRVFPVAGWGHGMLPSDRSPWSTREGVRLRNKDELTPELGYEWAGGWHLVDMSVIGSDEVDAYGSDPLVDDSDKKKSKSQAKKSPEKQSAKKAGNVNDNDNDNENDGWYYAVDFKGSYHPEEGALDCVRRRCWRRAMKLSKREADKMPSLEASLNATSSTAATTSTAAATPATTPATSPHKSALKHTVSDLHDSKLQTKREGGGITPSPIQHPHDLASSKKRSPNSPWTRNETSLPMAEAPLPGQNGDDDVILSPSSE